jgi:hypothetical protein
MGRLPYLVMDDRPIYNRQFCAAGLPDRSNERNEIDISDLNKMDLVDGATWCIPQKSSTSRQRFAWRCASDNSSVQFPLSTMMR